MSRFDDDCEGPVVVRRPAYDSGMKLEDQVKAGARGPAFETARVRAAEFEAAGKTGDAAFWTEVRTVARAIYAVYRPIHLNFQVLGNQDPHLHVHVVPRFDPDPAPSFPLPEAAWTSSKALTSDEVAQQTAKLRAACPVDGSPG